MRGLLVGFGVLGLLLTSLIWIYWYDIRWYYRHFVSGPETIQRTYLLCRDFQHSNGRPPRDTSEAGCTEAERYQLNGTNWPSGDEPFVVDVVINEFGVRYMTKNGELKFAQPSELSQALTPSVRGSLRKRAASN